MFLTVKIEVQSQEKTLHTSPETQKHLNTKLFEVQISNGWSMCYVLDQPFNYRTST